MRALKTETRVRKEPFDITKALSAIRRAVRPFPKAAMFELAELGYASIFEQLVACIISIRTLDEVSLPAAVRLLEKARTPKQILALGPQEVDRLIRPSTFHLAKAYQIHAIARETIDVYGGELPADPEALKQFRGVGPKCANLALGVSVGHPSISVDIHVHRVTNRWGYVKASAPEKTMGLLETQLPKKHWIEINQLLVPFGKHICTGSKPKCSTCPVLSMCQQVGVTSHR